MPFTSDPFSPKQNATLFAANQSSVYPLYVDQATMPPLQSSSFSREQRPFLPFTASQHLTLQHRKDASPAIYSSWTYSNSPAWTPAASSHRTESAACPPGPGDRCPWCAPITSWRFAASRAIQAIHISQCPNQPLSCFIHLWSLKTKQIKRRKKKYEVNDRGNRCVRYG